MITSNGDWTRVALFGTLDGFTYSTDYLPKTVVILDGGEKVEVPDEYVTSADQIVKKNEIKLKDVIKRIEKFDLGTKAVWINEILYKLGSDYGLHKYYEGYKKGELEGAMEREKVVVPQFVADWIERSKQEKRNIRNALNNGGEKMRLWFLDLENYDTFVRAWLDGYEVEKESQYLVKIKATKHFLARDGLEKIFFSLRYKSWFTRKDLEQAGFGWVFSCEGVEVEEVE